MCLYILESRNCATIVYIAPSISALLALGTDCFLHFTSFRDIDFCTLRLCIFWTNANLWHTHTRTMLSKFNADIRSHQIRLKSKWMNKWRKIEWMRHTQKPFTNKKLWRLKLYESVSVSPDFFHTLIYSNWLLYGLFRLISIQFGVYVKWH